MRYSVEGGLQDGRAVALAMRTLRQPWHVPFGALHECKSVRPRVDPQCMRPVQYEVDALVICLPA